MRPVAWLLASFVLASAACQPAPGEPRPQRHQAARLVLASFTDRTMHLHPVDPITLEDVPELSPLDVHGCGLTATQPRGALLAVVECGASEGAAVRVLDLAAWQWRADLSLAQPGQEAPARVARLLGAGSMAWSADGNWLYVVTATPTVPRRLWRLDPSGASAPVSVDLGNVPLRLDVSPIGTGVYLLSAQAHGALLDVFDPTTLALRTHVPLPDARLVPPSRETRPIIPAVALAPDGSRYYLARADEPFLDVVDVRAPGLERLERSVALRSAPASAPSTSVWLAASPDGTHLRTWRRVQAWADETGLQSIDTRTWQATTIDSIAMRLWSTLDGQWLVRLDPPAARFSSDWRNAVGARLSLLDPATGEELAAPLEGTLPWNLGQYGDERLYVQSGRPATVTAYEPGTWREAARREHTWLVTAAALR